MVKDFAELYINRKKRKIIQPDVFFYYSNYKPNKEISDLTGKLKIKAISKLKLSASLEEKIYIALFELTNATVLSSGKYFIDRNKKIANNRRKTIKYLEQALDYPMLSENCRNAIQQEIVMLSGINKERKEYHPKNELDFFATNTMISACLKKLAKKSKISPHKMRRIIDSGNRIKLALLFSDDSDHKLIEGYRILSDKLYRLLTQPMTVQEGRQPKFFLKALQLIIYSYLNSETTLPLEKVKNLTAEIINEYCKKMGYSKTILFLKAKDIDNAIHHSS